MRPLTLGLAIGLIVGAGLALLASTVHTPLPKAEAEGAVAELRHDEPAQRLIMASQFPADLPALGALALETASAIEIDTQGALHVDPDEQGDAVAALGLFDAVAARRIDAAFGTPGLWRDQQPAFELFGGIPFGPGATEYLGWYAQSGQALHDDLYHLAKVHGILCGIATGAGAWFRNPVKGSRDLDRVQIGAAGLAGRMLAAFGAYPQRLAPRDAPAVLQSGKVAGTQGLAPAADRAQMRLAGAKHYYYPAWQPFLPLEMIVNLDAWTMLGGAERHAIETVCAANVARGLAITASSDVTILKEMMREGFDVRRFPDALTEALRTAWTQASAKLAAEDQEFSLLWSSLKQFRADYALQQELALPRRQP